MHIFGWRSLPMPPDQEKKNKHESKKPTLIFWTAVRRSWQPPAPSGSQAACYRREPSPCQRPSLHLLLSHLKSPTQLPELPPVSRWVGEAAMINQLLPPPCVQISTSLFALLAEAPGERESERKGGCVCGRLAPSQVPLRRRGE